MPNVELFQGDIALISGANKGIGFEIARGLGAKKIKVLMGARDQARGQAAVEKLKAEGADARFIKLDVTDSGTIQHAAEWIEKEFGRLDILVNNAGIGDMGAKPSGASLARVREIYETNLFGPMAMTQAFLPLLKKSKHGRIVNVSSGLGSLTLASKPDSPIAQMAISRLQHIEICPEQHDGTVCERAEGHAHQSERHLPGLLRHRYEWQQRATHRCARSRGGHPICHHWRRWTQRRLFQRRRNNAVVVGV